MDAIKETLMALCEKYDTQDTVTEAVVEELQKLADLAKERLAQQPQDEDNGGGGGVKRKREEENEAAATPPTQPHDQEGCPPSPKRPRTEEETA